MDGRSADKISILRVSDLSLQLEEGQAVLAALRAGEVDALVVSQPDGDQVYTLQSADRVYQMLLERMGTGALLLSRNGTVLFSNPCFTELLGRSGEDLRAARIEDIVVETDRGCLERALAEVREAPTTCEANAVRRDGSVVPIEFAISSLGEVGDDALCAIVTDLSEHRRVEMWLEERVQERTAELEAANLRLQQEIDERRRVEEALRESEDRFRALNTTLEERVMERTASLRQSERALRDSQEQLQYVLEESGMGVWSIDLTTRAIWRSPHHDRIFGYNEMLPESTVETFLDHVLPEDRERTQAAMQEAMRSKRKQVFIECRIRRRDGVVRLICMRTHIRHNEHGVPVRLLGLTQDITEENRVQKAMRQSERLAAMGAAMAVISHESRNALQRSQTCLDMLTRRLPGNGEALRLIEMARGAQQDVQRVHEEIREFTAPITLHRSLHRVDTIWREAWEDLAELRQGRNAELIEIVRASECDGEVDPFRLKQVFRNILENSLSACGAPALIRVECSSAELNGKDALRIAIRDNGPGLTPEQKVRAFEPFYTTKTKGTGLGMTITKRVVESHGGQVFFSDDEEAGLELVLILPRRAE